MSQRDIREVMCDNTGEHRTPRTATVENGVMPTGWRQITIFPNNEERLRLIFDACSPGCAAVVATIYIRRHVYGMEE